MKKDHLENLVSVSHRLLVINKYINGMLITVLTDKTVRQRTAREWTTLYTKNPKTFHKNFKQVFSEFIQKNEDKMQLHTYSMYYKTPASNILWLETAYSLTDEDKKFLYHLRDLIELYKAQAQMLVKEKALDMGFVKIVDYYRHLRECGSLK